LYCPTIRRLSSTIPTRNPTKKGAEKQRDSIKYFMIGIAPFLPFFPSKKRRRSTFQDTETHL